MFLSNHADPSHLWGSRVVVVTNVGGRDRLRSARRTQPAAHRANWADALKMVKERNPVVADTILGTLESGAETSSAQAILKCSQILYNAGFESPA